MTSRGTEDGTDPIEARDAVARFAATRHSDGDWSDLTPEEAPRVRDVAAFWRHLDAVADDPVMAAMRSEARSRLPPLPRARAGRGVLAGGAAAVIAVAAAGALLIGRDEGPKPTRPSPRLAEAGRVIDNPHGAPRTVTLADGSRVTLDTESRIAVADGNGDRRVRVERGRAFFTVRHDARRPFRVDLGGSRITDIGTRFEASLTGGIPSVTLIEGAVRVDAPGRTAVRMAPGSRLTLRDGKWTLAHDDIARSTEWRDAVLSVDNRPLGEVVAAMNRYLDHPLVVAAPAAARMRISGTFQLDDPNGFIAALSAMGYENTVRSTR